jgi:hypothetical protein
MDGVDMSSVTSTFEFRGDRIRLCFFFFFLPESFDARLNVPDVDLMLAGLSPSGASDSNRPVSRRLPKAMANSSSKGTASSSSSLGIRSPRELNEFAVSLDDCVEER